MGTLVFWVSVGNAAASANIIRTEAPILYVSSPATPGSGESAGPEVVAPEQLPEPSPELFFKTSVLPGGEKGKAYSLNAITLVGWNNLEAAETAPQVVWSSSSTMPPGLSLNTSGYFSGVPTSTGTYSINLTASYNSISLSRQMSLLVNNPPCINPKTAAAGTKSSNYCGFVGLEMISVGATSYMFLANDSQNNTWTGAASTCGSVNRPTRSMLRSFLLNIPLAQSGMIQSKTYWSSDVYEHGRPWYVHRSYNGSVMEGHGHSGEIRGVRCIRRF